MSSPTPAGLFIYAKNAVRIANFYETILGMTRLYAPHELIVLEIQNV